MSNTNMPETKCVICGLRVSKWLEADHKHKTAAEEFHEAANKRKTELFETVRNSPKFVDLKCTVCGAPLALHELKHSETLPNAVAPQSTATPDVQMSEPKPDELDPRFDPDEMDWPKTKELKGNNNRLKVIDAICFKPHVSAHLEQIEAIEALIATQRQEANKQGRIDEVKLLQKRVIGSSTLWPLYANLDREHAINDARNTIDGIIVARLEELNKV